MTSDQLAQGIIRQASRFIGLREVKPNADWDNPNTPGNDRALVDELRSLMRQSPWEPGWAYCAAFAEGMVLAVIRHPMERRTLAGDAPHPGVKHLHSPGGRETAMREETVIAEADAKAAGGPTERHADRQPRPGEVEGGHQGRSMDHADPDHDRPVEVGPVLSGLAAERVGFCGQFLGIDHRGVAVQFALRATDRRSSEGKLGGIDIDRLAAGGVCRMRRCGSRGR